MSAYLVVSTRVESFAKQVASALRQVSRGTTFVETEVGDELDLAYGAQRAVSSGASVVVCVGCVIGAEAASLLGAVASSVTRVGLDSGVPVLCGVSAFSNDLVARRADARAIAESLAMRVSKLTRGGGGGGGFSSAPAPQASSAAAQRGRAAAPPPPAAASPAGPRGGYSAGPSGAGSGAGGRHAAGPSAGAGYGRAPASPSRGGATEPAPYRGPSRTTADAGAMGVQPILGRLREQLRKHGASGIFGLGRKFRIMDDDGSKSINRAEFSKALRETGVDLTAAELSKVYTYFDHDGSGSISYDEFLVGVRGELNARRQDIVRQAFAVVDKDGSGVLDLSDIIAAYDTSQHPDVLAGRKTKNEVFREFLDNFDGGEKDGVVHPEEFERYYASLSASIDDDDYFELMIRNAWHISGGEGWAQNTTCRRVLVTRWDGKKEVVELKNDIGVGNDPAAIKAALRRQGEEFQSVSLYGVEDSTKPATASPPSRFSSTPRRTVFESSISF